MSRLYGFLLLLLVTTPSKGFDAGSVGEYFIEKFGGEIVQSWIDAWNDGKGERPWVDRAAFDFLKVNRNESIDVQMSNNDAVRVIGGIDSDTPENAVKLTFKCSADNWWKAINVMNATGNAYVSSLLTSESVGRETSAYVYATDFQFPLSLVLSKAGAFGVHENMHLIQGTMNLKWGRTYMDMYITLID